MESGKAEQVASIISKQRDAQGKPMTRVEYEEMLYMLKTGKTMKGINLVK